MRIGLQEQAGYHKTGQGLIPKTILTPISNPVIPVTPLESLANRDHPEATFIRSDKRGFFVPRKYQNRRRNNASLLRIFNDERAKAIHEFESG